MIVTIDHVYRLQKESIRRQGYRGKNGREFVKSWMYYVVFCTETHVQCCGQSPPNIILSRSAISKETFERFVAAGARNSGDVVR